MKNDKSLADDIPSGEGPHFIENPKIIVHGDHDTNKFLINLTGFDPSANDPIRAGILMSDLIDHIAHAYGDVSKRDWRDIRDHIIKVIRDETRFKDKDPNRGNMRGFTLLPKGH